MVKLVIHILLLAVVVVFVALNVPYTTSINLFGYMFEDVSTVAVVLLAFIVGIIYSFFYYVLNYFYKSGRKKDKERRQKTKVKEKELQAKETEIGSKKTKEIPAVTNTQMDTEIAEKETKKKKGLFSKNKEAKDKT